MAGDRVRGGDHLATTGLRTPPDIDVLEVREQVAVEAAARIPMLAPDGHVAAAREGHRLADRR